MATTSNLAERKIDLERRVRKKWKTGDARSVESNIRFGLAPYETGSHSDEYFSINRSIEVSVVREGTVSSAQIVTKRRSIFDGFSRRDFFVCAIPVVSLAIGVAAFYIFLIILISGTVAYIVPAGFLCISAISFALVSGRVIIRKYTEKRNESD